MQNATRTTGNGPITPHSRGAESRLRALTALGFGPALRSPDREDPIECGRFEPPYPPAGPMTRSIVEYGPGEPSPSGRGTRIRVVGVGGARERDDAGELIEPEAVRSGRRRRVRREELVDPSVWPQDRRQE